MLDLSKIVKEVIPNYPTCPVDRICKKISQYKPEEIDEQKVLEFLGEIKKHENELRVFRRELETKLLEYQVHSITEKEK